MPRVLSIPGLTAIDLMPHGNTDIEIRRMASRAAWPISRPIYDDARHRHLSALTATRCNKHQQRPRRRQGYRRHRL